MDNQKPNDPSRLDALIAALEFKSEVDKLLIKANDQQGDGGFEQRDRIEIGARWACENFGGDLVELGCLNGSTTVRLAGVAREYGRRVIAIDPFELGTQNVSADTFAIFTETIKPYANVIDFMRMRSDDPRVENRLKDASIALAFIDGLHTQEMALHDLQMVAHASLSVLDDTRAVQEVLGALGIMERSWGGPSRNAPMILNRFYWRESWIVRNVEIR